MNDAAETQQNQPTGQSPQVSVDSAGDSVSDSFGELAEAPFDGQSNVDVAHDQASTIIDDASATTAAATGRIATHAAATEAQQPVASSAPRYQDPSFTLQRAQATTPARTAKWQWAALLLLATTLGLQVLLADRERLAADAGWRPTIAFLCSVAGCSLPAWHQPGAFAMLSRDVSPIPGTGGLNVRATFRNDARWPQPWPMLLLSLSDADGRVLGARAFSPREYLGAGATQTELAPGQSAQIALKLQEPNPDVVAFSFDFR
ncbi:MAG: DUF3426 domain-containing protein [Pseudoxanthomonas sp.]